MCTISYIPIPHFKGFVITDSRDESINRPALSPELYEELGCQLFYPKDTLSGGTWIGVSSEKRLMALMNGAFSRHERKPFYRKSRGLVVKEILSSKELDQYLIKYDFTGIEPFYGVIFSWQSKMLILDIIWDGLELNYRVNDPESSHIWSASMTYTPDQKAKRTDTFSQYVKQISDSDNIPKKLWDFHHQKGDGKNEGILIDRGLLKTTSITQFIHLDGRSDSYRYVDLITNQESEGSVLWNNS